MQPNALLSTNPPNLVDVVERATGSGAQSGRNKKRYQTAFDVFLDRQSQRFPCYETKTRSEKGQNNVETRSEYGRVFEKTNKSNLSKKTWNQAQECEV
jgi:hypothetical protein